MIIAVNNPNQATGKKKPEKNQGFNGIHHSRWSLDFFQASSFQLFKLDNLLQWSFFTFIYNRSSNMNYFIYTSQKWSVQCNFWQSEFLTFKKAKVCERIQWRISRFLYLLDDESHVTGLWHGYRIKMGSKQGICLIISSYSAPIIQKYLLLLV